jgi:glycosyltransferase involved in cell wall biosynthesis
MKRVAMMIPTIDRIGGAERQALLLAKGLAARGWRVTLVTLAGCGGAEKERLAQAGVGYLSLEMRKGLADPRGWRQLRCWLRQERPQVVHAHLAHAAWMARAVRLIAPAPVVVDTLHSSATGGWTRRLGYRMSRGLSDCVTAVSASVAQAHLAKAMARPERLLVLPNGVNLDEWRPDAGRRAAKRRALGIGEEFLWIAAGRLEPVKDYPTLLKAMALAPEARLAIAGAGAQEGELRRLIAALNLGARVRLIGFEPDLTDWMRAADGFVAASLWEGLPMSLLEAAACALPAVATDVPGLRDAVRPGETGFLAKAGDSNALAAAMRRLMAAETRAAMGAQARARVEREYSLTAVLDRWERLYEELIAGAAGWKRFP